METFKLYGGDITLQYDDDKHKYVVDGNVIDFTASQCSNFFNQPWMIPWGKKVMREAAVEEYKKFSQVIGTLVESGVKIKASNFLDEVKIKELEKRLNAATRKTSDRALLIGDLVHRYAHEFALGKEPDLPHNEDAARACAAFKEKFWEKFDVTPVDAEAKVYSAKHTYAGSLDLDAHTTLGRSIVDYKTTNNLRRFSPKVEHIVQCAGYAKAREEEGHGPYDVLLVVEIDRGDGDVRVTAWEDIERAFTAFRACVYNYRLQKEASKLPK